MTRSAIRRLEKRRAWEAEQEKRLRAEAIERERKDALDMYLRIEESDASSDVKDILHRIAVHLGLEE